MGYIEWSCEKHSPITKNGSNMGAVSRLKKHFSILILGAGFLFAGAIAGVAISPVQAAETGGCSYLWCHEPSGQCLSNENATKCLSSTGQLPCEDDAPCYGGG